MSTIFTSTNNNKMENSETKLKDAYIPDNAHLAEHLGLDYVETTAGMNGYPESIQYALISDSIETLLDAKTTLEAQGFEVEELFLTKRDGQQLWNRTRTWVERGQLQKESETDFTFCFNSDQDEDQIKEEIFSEVFGFDGLLGDYEEYRTYEKLKELTSKVDSFFDELPSGQGSVTVFYDPNNDYYIDYCVSEDSASYSYDCSSTRLAIRVCNL